MFFKSLLLGLMFIIAVVAAVLFGTPVFAKMGLMPDYAATSPENCDGTHENGMREAASKPQSRWLRQVLDKREKIAKEEREGVKVSSENSEAEEPLNSAQNLNEIQDETETQNINKTQDASGSSYAGYDDFEKTENIDTPQSTTSSTSTTTTTIVEREEKNVFNHGTAHATFETLMSEVNNIEREDLHDQAYFEIVNFAISNGLFSEALSAHEKISQTELAYTARGQIAVAYAKNGQAELAFATIDKVADAQLRDFMRLQVIESVSMPEKSTENLTDIK